MHCISWAWESPLPRKVIVKKFREIDKVMVVGYFKCMASKFDVYSECFGESSAVCGLEGWQWQESRLEQPCSDALEKGVRLKRDQKQVTN